MTITEPPLGYDQKEICPNCGATMPLNHVRFGACTRCIEMVDGTETVDEDADNSEYTHPRFR